MRIIAALVCLLFVAVAFAQTKAPVAKNSADAEKKIEALRKEIKSLSKAQREVEEKRNLEAKQLRQIDQKVAVSSQSLTKIEGAINGSEKKLDQLETEQQRLERNLREQKDQLALLIRSAYRLGDNSELKHLF
jgi:murein hydrolase activator